MWPRCKAKSHQGANSVANSLLAWPAGEASLQKPAAEKLPGAEGASAPG